MIDFEILTVGLHIAKELKTWARRCVASVAMKYRAGQGIIKEGPAVLAAATPFIACGAASSRSLWGGSRLECLLEIATAGSGGVAWIKACRRECS